ncbi:MAG: hypothetical protein ABEI13_03840 [Candidatus Paceibacteria bacterium]
MSEMTNAFDLRKNYPDISHGDLSESTLRTLSVNLDLASILSCIQNIVSMGGMQRPISIILHDSSSLAIYMYGYIIEQLQKSKHSLRRENLYTVWVAGIQKVTFDFGPDVPETDRKEFEMHVRDYKVESGPFDWVKNLFKQWKNLF